jgi:hypothetical protein
MRPEHRPGNNFLTIDDGTGHPALVNRNGRYAGGGLWVMTAAIMGKMGNGHYVLPLA